MLLQYQPLLAADSDPTPLYPWQPALQGLAVVVVVVFAIAVVADVTSACHSCFCSQMSSVGLLDLSFAPPPSTFVLPPSSIAPHQQRRAAVPVFMRARARKKSEHLPCTQRPPLVSVRPFPIRVNRPLCPAVPSSCSTTAPCVRVPLPSTWQTAPCVQEPLPHTERRPSVSGGSSIHAATAPRVWEPVPYPRRRLLMSGSSVPVAAQRVRHPLPPVPLFLFSTSGGSFSSLVFLSFSPHCFRTFSFMCAHALSTVSAFICFSFLVGCLTSSMKWAFSKYGIIPLVVIGVALLVATTAEGKGPPNS